MYKLDRNGENVIINASLCDWVADEDEGMNLDHILGLGEFFDRQQQLGIRACPGNITRGGNGLKLACKECFLRLNSCRQNSS